MRRDRREFNHGDRVRIGGAVAGHDTEGNLRGAGGRVCGENAVQERAGQKLVNVQLDDGRVVLVPSRAVEKHSP